MPLPTRGWTFVRNYTPPGSSDPIAFYLNGVLCVGSAREWIEKNGILTQQFHISVTERSGRPCDDSVRGVLADFGMEGADEDNHTSGRARHFWLVDDGRTVEPPCECKATEETVTEPDGYQWQKEKA